VIIYLFRSPLLLLTAAGSARLLGGTNTELYLQTKPRWLIYAYCPQRPKRISQILVGKVAEPRRLDKVVVVPNLACEEPGLRLTVQLLCSF
jgi:hypothetical protein